MNIKKSRIPLEAALELLKQGHAGISLSQSCEDAILSIFFRDKMNGFYVDIGAYDPIKISNTYLLHTFQNWSGINIDADPAAIAKFEIMRPGDRNIHAAVSNSEDDTIILSTYSDGAINTIDHAMRAKHASKGTKIAREIAVPVRSLASIFEEHLPSSKIIDFIDIDIEGAELEALSSNNWSKYRPDFIFAEVHKFDLSRSAGHELVAYMASVGYRVLYFVHVTLVFINERK